MSELPWADSGDQLPIDVLSEISYEWLVAALGTHAEARRQLRERHKVGGPEQIFHVGNTVATLSATGSTTMEHLLAEINTGVTPDPIHAALFSTPNICYIDSLLAALVAHGYYLDSIDRYAHGVHNSSLHANTELVASQIAQLRQQLTPGDRLNLLDLSGSLKLFVTPEEEQVRRVLLTSSVEFIDLPLDL